MGVYRIGVAVAAAVVTLGGGSVTAGATATSGSVAQVAPAAAATELRVSVGPASMHPGGTVTVSGSGFGPGSVVVRLGGAAVSVAVDRAGRFATRIKVPWKTIPGMITVTATQGARRASTRLRVGVDWKIPGMTRAHSFVNPYEKQLTRSSVARLGVAGRYALPEKWADNTFAWFSTLGDTAYACTLLGDVVKFDLPSRTPVWRYLQRDESGVQVCSGEGGPYVAPNGDVWIGQIRLNGKTGAEEYWGYTADATLAYGDNILALGTSHVPNAPFAMDPKTGEIVWMAKVGGYGALITSAGILYHWDSDGLNASDPNTGRLLWSRQYEDTGGISNLASNGKQLVGFVWRPSEEGGGALLSRIDPETGDPMWSSDIIRGPSSFVTVDADRAYLIRSLTASGDQSLVGIGLDGTQQWATLLPKADVLLDTRITQANGILYVPLYGALTTYDATTGTLLDTLPLRDPTGAKVVPGSVIVDDGHVYVTSTTGVYDVTTT